MTTETSQKTIKALLSHATAKIGRFEASILLGHVLQKPREYLIAHDDEIVNDLTITTFNMLVDTRLEGMPVPYLTGRQEFFGRYFTVTSDVLIPRPDTEVLIEQALLVTPPRAHVLEMGTGSGCIAVTLKLQNPGLTVTATDRSPEALAVAQANAKDLAADITFAQGSWYEAVPEEQTFDVICSNPPYIHRNDHHLKGLVYEPQEALTDFEDGLSCLREIVRGAPKHLKLGGWLLVEHGYDQGQAVRQLFTDAGFAAVRTVKDYGDNDRLTMGRIPA